MRASPAYSDLYSTPYEALESLWEWANKIRSEKPYLGLPAPLNRIWEPACGEGKIARWLQIKGREVISTDINPEFTKFDDDCWDGKCSYHDFLQPRSWDIFNPSAPLSNQYDAIITGPPFSLKEQFVEQCCSLQKPFALLLPVAAIKNSILRMCENYDLQFLYCGKCVFEHFREIPFPKRRITLDVLWLCRDMLSEKVKYSFNI